MQGYQFFNVGHELGFCGLRYVAQVFNLPSNGFGVVVELVENLGEE
jgi:hypothetical protein